MRVVHVISGLAVGGAEVMLQKLMRTMDPDQFDPVVVSLRRGGEIGDQLRAEGFAVHDLGLTGSMVTPGAVWRLRNLARDLKPQVIQGWMYHGNLAAALMARLSPGDPDLFWNIRHSVDDIGREKMGTRLVIRLGGVISGAPKRIVFNSGLSLEQHGGLGYPRNSSLMIPNGFDLDRFGPSPEAGAELREELGLPGDTLLVGVAARRHPMKGHEAFLEAAVRLRTGGRNIHFVLVGRGVTPDDPVLRDLSGRFENESPVHLLGLREDMPSFLAGLDLLCVPSLYGEGFPNVLGEAMACGVPCVATDVGESREIVADLGRIVQPGDPAALAAAMGEILAMDSEARSDLGARCRARIQENYSLENIAERYAALYLSG